MSVDLGTTQTLEELEGVARGNCPSTRTRRAPCHRLRRIPVAEFAAEDRINIARPASATLAH